MTGDRFATLTFQRKVAAPVATLYHAWTAPAARAVWSSPGQGVTVEILHSDARIGGEELSVCRAEGTPEVTVQARWLALQPNERTVGTEVVSSQGAVDGVALVTAGFTAEGDGSRIDVTVQLSSLANDMAPGYQFGYGGGLDNLAQVAERTMLISRVIQAPVAAVWGAWTDPESLPRWWGPDGFSCKTSKIDLRAGGEWVFDMIGPDGTVFPNHHRYGQVIPGARLDYALLAGENGPKHADAWAEFTDIGEATRVTLGMVMETTEHYRNAKGFGAEALGLQTLGKLARAVGAD